MNREIKFRCWDNKRNRFINEEKDCFCFPQDIIFCIFKGQFDGCCPADITRSKYLVIQQYTGFKDMDGKEIYEGDIIEWPGSSYSMNRRSILFDEDDGYWRISGDSFDGFDDLALSMNGGKWNGPVKVVGNICQNPDLLK